MNPRMEDEYDSGDSRGSIRDRLVNAGERDELRKGIRSRRHVLELRERHAKMRARASRALSGHIIRYGRRDREGLGSIAIGQWGSFLPVRKNAGHPAPGQSMPLPSVAEAAVNPDLITETMAGSGDSKTKKEMEMEDLRRRCNEFLINKGLKENPQASLQGSAVPAPAPGFRRTPTSSAIIKKLSLESRVLPLSRVLICKLTTVVNHLKSVKSAGPSIFSNPDPGFTKGVHREEGELSPPTKVPAALNKTSDTGLPGVPPNRDPASISEVKKAVHEVNDTSTQQAVSNKSKFVGGAISGSNVGKKGEQASTAGRKLGREMAPPTVNTSRNSGPVDVAPFANNAGRRAGQESTSSGKKIEHEMAHLMVTIPKVKPLDTGATGSGLSRPLAPTISGGGSISRKPAAEEAVPVGKKIGRKSIPGMAPPGSKSGWSVDNDGSPSGSSAGRKRGSEIALSDSQLVRNGSASIPAGPPSAVTNKIAGKPSSHGVPKMGRDSSTPSGSSVGRNSDRDLTPTGKTVERELTSRGIVGRRPDRENNTPSGSSLARRKTADKARKAGKKFPSKSTSLFGDSSEESERSDMDSPPRSSAGRSQVTETNSEMKRSRKGASGGSKPPAVEPARQLVSDKELAVATIQPEPVPATALVPVGVIQPSVALDNWVECSKCQTWRLVHPNVDRDFSKGKWYCRFNDWVPASIAHCGVSQDDTTKAVYTSLGLVFDPVAIAAAAAAAAEASAEVPLPVQEQPLSHAPKKLTVAAPEGDSGERLPSGLKRVTSGRGLKGAGKTGQDLKSEGADDGAGWTIAALPSGAPGDSARLRLRRSGSESEDLAMEKKKRAKEKVNSLPVSDIPETGQGATFSKVKKTNLRQVDESGPSRPKVPREVSGGYLNPKPRHPSGAKESSDLRRSQPAAMELNHEDRQTEMESFEMDSSDLGPAAAMDSESRRQPGRAIDKKSANPSSRAAIAVQRQRESSSRKQQVEASLSPSSSTDISTSSDTSDSSELSPEVEQAEAARQHEDAAECNGSPAQKPLKREGSTAQPPSSTVGNVFPLSKPIIEPAKEGTEDPSRGEMEGGDRGWMGPLNRPKGRSPDRGYDREQGSSQEHSRDRIRDRSHDRSRERSRDRNRDRDDVASDHGRRFSPRGRDRWKDSRGFEGDGDRGRSRGRDQYGRDSTNWGREGDRVTNSRREDGHDGFNRGRYDGNKSDRPAARPASNARAAGGSSHYRANESETLYGSGLGDGAGSGVAVAPPPLVEKKREESEQNLQRERGGRAENRMAAAAPPAAVPLTAAGGAGGAVASAGAGAGRKKMTGTGVAVATTARVATAEAPKENVRPWQDTNPTSRGNEAGGNGVTDRRKGVPAAAAGGGGGGGTAGGIAEHVRRAPAGAVAAAAIGSIAAPSTVALAAERDGDKQKVAENRQNRRKNGEAVKGSSTAAGQPAGTTIGSTESSRHDKEVADSSIRLEARRLKHAADACTEDRREQVRLYFHSALKFMETTSDVIGLISHIATEYERHSCRAGAAIAHQLIGILHLRNYLREKTVRQQYDSLKGVLDSPAMAAKRDESGSLNSSRNVSEYRQIFIDSLELNQAFASMARSVNHRQAVLTEGNSSQLALNALAAISNVDGTESLSVILERAREVLRAFGLYDPQR